MVPYETNNPPNPIISIKKKVVELFHVSALNEERPLAEIVSAFQLCCL